MLFPFVSPLTQLCYIEVSARGPRNPVASDNREFCDELVYLQTYCQWFLFLTLETKHGQPPLNYVGIEECVVHIYLYILRVHNIVKFETHRCFEFVLLFSEHRMVVENRPLLLFYACRSYVDFELNMC